MADILAVAIAVVGLAGIVAVYRHQNGWARRTLRAIRALPEHHRHRERA